MWVEAGIEYEISLAARRFDNSTNVSTVEPLCYGMSFSGSAFSESSGYDFSPFSIGSLCIVTVQILAAPEDEFEVNATDGQFSNIVRVTWNEQDGATGYEVYRCASEVEDDCGTAIGTTSENGYNDESAVANTIYYYRVKACSAGGCGDFSPEDPGYRVVDDHGNDCTGATIVEGDSTTSGEIEWTLPGDVDYFEIQLDATSVLTVSTTGATNTVGRLFDTECILSYLESNNDGGEGTNFLISRDLAEGAYWVEVGHQSGSGNGPYVFVSETAPSTELPWDASYVNASEGTDDTYVFLTWPRAPLSLASGYNIYRSDSLESEKVFLKTVGADETDDYGYETSIPDLAPDVRYFFWVFSVNSNGESEFGVYDEGWRATPVADPPEAPSLNSATPGIAQIELQFTPNGDGGSEITGYTANCDGHEQSASTSPITVTGLSNGVEYSCTVIATNVVGDSPPSNALQATPSAPDPVFGDGFEDE